MFHSIICVFGKETGFMALLKPCIQPHATWSSYMDIGLDILRVQNSNTLVLVTFGSAN